MVTNISGQNCDVSTIDCTYSELKNNFDNTKGNYSTAYLMRKFMLDNYGQHFILNLIKNWQLLDEFAPKLYEQTRKVYNQTEIGLEGICFFI